MLCNSNSFSWKKLFLFIFCIGLNIWKNGERRLVKKDIYSGCAGPQANWGEVDQRMDGGSQRLFGYNWFAIQEVKECIKDRREWKRIYSVVT